MGLHVPNLTCDATNRATNRRARWNHVWSNTILNLPSNGAK